MVQLEIFIFILFICLLKGAVAYFIESAMLPDVAQAIELFSTVSHVIEVMIM